MDITLTRTRRSELVTAIADLELRGWHCISPIKREEREMKQFRRTGRWHEYMEHAHAEKYMVRMRKVDELEEAQ